MACSMPRQLDFADLKKAEVIFRGKIVKYQIVSPRMAKLRFDVLHVYKGHSPESIEVVWQGAGPKNITEFRDREWDGGRSYRLVRDRGVKLNHDMLIAIETPLPYGINENGQTEKVPPISDEIAKLWEFPWVLQTSCAPPFMFSMEEIAENKQLKENLSKYIDLEE